MSDNLIYMLLVSHAMEVICVTGMYVPLSLLPNGIAQETLEEMSIFLLFDTLFLLSVTMYLVWLIVMVIH